MSTIFTRIINGEIPAYKVAETDGYIAFLDIAPVTKGHTLVVPKEETDYIFDLDDPTYLGLQAFAKKVAEGIKRATCKRVGVLRWVGSSHAHIHLVLQSKPIAQFPPETAGRWNFDVIRMQLPHRSFFTDLCFSCTPEYL